MEKSIKEKRLKIFSLAMDINEKYGAVCFVDYKPHTDAIYVNIFSEPWFAFAKSEEYVSYKKEKYANGKKILTHDEMILKLEKMLSNEK